MMNARWFDPRMYTYSRRISFIFEQVGTLQVTEMFMVQVLPLVWIISDCERERWFYSVLLLKELPMFLYCVVLRFLKFGKSGLFWLCFFIFYLFIFKKAISLVAWQFENTLMLYDHHRGNPIYNWWWRRIAAYAHRIRTLLLYERVKSHLTTRVYMESFSFFDMFTFNCTNS